MRIVVPEVLLLFVSLEHFFPSNSITNNSTTTDEIDRIVAQVHPKVELHVHFEGSLKDTTAYELLKKKNSSSLPGDGTQLSFRETIKTLPFQDLYRLFLSAIRGDLEAIERVAYELCEMESEAGVIYTEVHYSPHFLLPESFHRGESDGGITIKDVVEAVNRGLERGQRRYSNLVVRSILLLVRSKPEWSHEVIDLADQFKDRGVVGIDIQGDIIGATSLPNEQGAANETLMFQKEHVEVFEMATRLGIKKTVHAGFLGSADSVLGALEVLKANRISHGYRVQDNEKLYKQLIKKGVHFEASPSSAATIANGGINPVVRYARDGASFSVSSDNPRLLASEYRTLAESGITVQQMRLSNINSMLNAFVEPQLKLMLLNVLSKAYGFADLKFY